MGAEMDLDAILTLHPQIVLVDELAHTNAPGSRHPKRSQDVGELLNAGISVWTTINIQHGESRAEIVAELTGITVRETVPDSLLDRANEIGLIDLPPEQLRVSLTEGKVYQAERAVMRRSHETTEAAVLEAGSLSVDLAARIVRLHDQEIKLTTIEYALLRVLQQHAGKASRKSNSCAKFGARKPKTKATTSACISPTSVRKSTRSTRAASKWRRALGIG